jgi:molybdopterin-containing oxidoreductase family membrane subunit
VFWLVIFCNVLAPQALWLGFFRKNTIALFIVAIIVNIGMWAERFMIVVVSLHRDFMPSKWHMYYPTFWDFATYAGTIGLFFFLFLLFIRILPMISMTEVRELVHQQHEEPAATEHAHG